MINMAAVCQLLRPGATHIVANTVPPHIKIDWEMVIDYTCDDIMFNCRFGSGRIERLRLFTRHEIDDNLYKKEFYPRLEGWLKRVMPKAHIQYQPKHRILHPRSRRLWPR